MAAIDKRLKVLETETQATQEKVRRDYYAFAATFTDEELEAIIRDEASEELLERSQKWADMPCPPEVEVEIEKMLKELENESD